MTLTPEEKGIINELVDRARRGGRSLADVLDAAKILWTTERDEQVRRHEVTKIEAELSRWHPWELGLLGGCRRGEIPDQFQMMDGFKKFLERRIW